MHQKIYVLSRNEVEVEEWAQLFWARAELWVSSPKLVEKSPEPASSMSFLLLKNKKSQAWSYFELLGWSFEPRAWSLFTARKNLARAFEPEPRLDPRLNWTRDCWANLVHSSVYDHLVRSSIRERRLGRNSRTAGSQELSAVVFPLGTPVSTDTIKSGSTVRLIFYFRGRCRQPNRETGLTEQAQSWETHRY